MTSEELGLSSLKVRAPRLAHLLARAAGRIRAHWFATGAALAVLLGLSVLLVLDAGAAAGWWKHLPPFHPPRSAPTPLLWLWHNSRYLWERALLLAASAVTGGLVALAAGRKFRAWLPVGVAEVLDRLWGYEYELTTAVAALSGSQITPPAAALGLQVEERLQQTPHRSLRGVGWGRVGRAPLRLLTAACLILAASSLTSFWLATHAPARRPGKEELPVSGPDSPLHSTFFALQQLADQLEAEALSIGERLPEGGLSQGASATEDQNRQTENEGRGWLRGEQGSRPGGTGSRAAARADRLRQAAASLRQAADLVAQGGAEALPYARELVLQAFNHLLQERLNQETGAGRNDMPVPGSGFSPGSSRIDSLLQELGEAARPLLSSGELAAFVGARGQDVWRGQGESAGQGQGQGPGQGQEQGEGQAQGQSQGSSEAPPQPGSTAHPTLPAAVPSGAEPGQTAADQYLAGLYPGAPGEAPDDWQHGGGPAASATTGTGRGSGTSTQRLGEPRELALPNSPAAPLTGELGQGPIWVTGSDRLPGAWQTGSYTLTDQTEVPGSGVEREDLPLAYREWVRRYFGGL
ncbi:MAG: hypothetical protein IMX00_06220 [Limnochordales bacterium]|nr:hypothetical protein [Limnochordales bacterium]